MSSPTQTGERSETAPARRRLPFGGYAAALGLLLVAHALVQLQVRPNPRWNDGTFMLNYARHFPDVPPNHYTLRIGLLLPTKLFEAVFGYGQVAYYAFPFLCGILLVVATYLLGASCSGPGRGCSPRRFSSSARSSSRPGPTRWGRRR